MTARVGYRARTKVRGHSVFIGWYPDRDAARAAVLRYRERKGLPVSAVDLREHHRAMCRLARSLR